MNFSEQIEKRSFKSKKPRIAWIFTDWCANAYRQENDLYGGIAYYRVIKPSQVLREFYDIEVIGQDFTHWGTMDEAYTRLGRDYDLIISKHIMNGQMASNILATAQHYKRKVIVDMDDNYLDIRADNPAAKDYEIGKEGRSYMQAFLELADGITVSTQPLKELYLRHNKKIDVLPNCNDIKDWATPFKRNDGFIRIGYAGGSAHNDDLDLICEPIAKILHKYPNVIFETVGAISVEKAREMAGKMLKFANHKILERFRITGGTLAWQGYPELLSSQGWDIGIAPLIDEPFNRGKSHIKWMEYAMIGIPTVASPVYPYIEAVQKVKVIEHGKTGLFASNADEWFENLEMLVKNPDIRERLARNAYEFIKEEWQQEQWAKKWKKVIDKYLCKASQI